MVWSPEIEAKAKRWAAMGRKQHSPTFLRQGVAGFELLGENIAVGVLNRTGRGSPGWAVDTWYKQMPASSGKSVEFSRETAMFTQLVWKNSTSLGCGFYSGFLVCWYGPAGNTEGDFDTQVSPVATNTTSCD